MLELIQTVDEKGKKTLINTDKVAAYIEDEETGNLTIMFSVGELWQTDIPFKNFKMSISATIYAPSQEKK